MQTLILAAVRWGSLASAQYFARVTAAILGIALCVALASRAPGQSSVPEIHFQQTAGDAADPFEAESTTEAAETSEPVTALSTPSADQATVPDIHFQPATNTAADPFESDVEADSTVASPTHAALVTQAEYLPKVSDRRLQLVKFQTPFADDATSTEDKPDVSKGPCGAAPSRPWNEFDIDVAIPDGDLPANQAKACWEHINQSGELSDARCWPQFCYAWDATCFCHRPLYFEEANLERYGYGCGCCYDSCCWEGHCLQTAASAAHFFGTIPALPYCLAAECPGQCQYTLGHYRPGSCPPWRHHYPSWNPVAALSAGGVWTGLVFLIP